MGHGGVNTGVAGLVRYAIIKAASGSGSVVEHLLAKEGVAGSNPVFRSIFLGGRSSVVEHLPSKQRVVGSIPIARSRYDSTLTDPD